MVDPSNNVNKLRAADENVRQVGDKKERSGSSQVMKRKKAKKLGLLEDPILPYQEIL